MSIISDAQDQSVTTGKADKAATGTPTLNKSNAVASTTTFVSGTAKQLNADRSVNLYIAYTTSGTMKIEMGADSTSLTTIMPSQTVGLGVSHLVVPAGWYVKLTGTQSNVACTVVV